MKNNLIKSKERIRNYGEVFTPESIVEEMLNLVNQEAERIESRFLEPACGEGIFLINILKRKLDIVKKIYKKNQFDYEKNSLIAISSIYGIDILSDNVKIARKRLYDFFLKNYESLYKNKIKNNFLNNIKFIIRKNIIQGNTLTFKDSKNNSIVFSEWVLINNLKIQRKDFQFIDLVLFNSKQSTLFEKKELAGNGEIHYSPNPIKEYKPILFYKLLEQEYVKSTNMI